MLQVWERTFFESYVGALVSALTLGIVYYKAEGAIFPLLIAGLGLVASILGTFFVKGDENSNPHKALKTGSYVASVLVLIVSCVFSKYSLEILKQQLPSLPV